MYNAKYMYTMICMWMVAPVTTCTTAAVNIRFTAVYIHEVRSTSVTTGSSWEKTLRGRCEPLNTYIRVSYDIKWIYTLLCSASVATVVVCMIAAEWGPVRRISLGFRWLDRTDILPSERSRILFWTRVYQFFKLQQRSSTTEYRYRFSWRLGPPDSSIMGAVIPVWCSKHPLERAWLVPSRGTTEMEKRAGYQLSVYLYCKLSPSSNCNCPPVSSEKDEDHIISITMRYCKYHTSIYHTYIAEIKIYEVQSSSIFVDKFFQISPPSRRSICGWMLEGCWKDCMWSKTPDAEQQ